MVKRMEYGDFYDIAVYGNEMWNKGNFSHKEVACYACDYYVAFRWSKRNTKISFVIQNLAKLLVEDGSEKCHDWLYDMAWELGLWDYKETDETNISKLLKVE